MDYLLLEGGDQVLRGAAQLVRGRQVAAAASPDSCPLSFIFLSSCNSYLYLLLCQNLMADRISVERIFLT